MKNELGERVVKLFIDWSKSFEELRNKKVCPQDFDCWFGGFVTGLAANKGFEEKDVRNMIDFVVNSQPVKDCGVTGTEKEKFTFYKE